MLMSKRNLASHLGGTVAIDQLTQEELLHSLHSNQIIIEGKSYQGNWRIAKGTRQALQQAIQNNTLQLSAVKQANALLDGRSIVYNGNNSQMYSHIFSTQDSRVQALLHLKPKNLD